MKYNENGEPTPENMNEVTDMAYDAYREGELDYDAVEDFCYKSYELGKQEAIDANKPTDVQDILTGTMYAVVEFVVRDLFPDDIGQDVMDNLLGRVMDGVPGLRTEVAEDINVLVLESLNGWDPIPEKQRAGILQVCEDVLIREGQG